VHALEGRCHFEEGSYAKAADVYGRCWQLDSRRVEGLEFYSSALWHLRREVELGVLGQKMMAIERRSSQVWCAIGSCFSLQRESEAAVKFFRRAVQVDSTFTYAYTLLGHEYATTDELEKAKMSYEQAVALDPRHYPAWWGLGHLSHRQEEYATAKYHFKRALDINRRNSVLLCYMGMVHQALNELTGALGVYTEAAQIDPKNFDALYKRALVLLELRQVDEGIAALQKLIQMAPREACLHFHLGKVLMPTEPQTALVHFHRALDLDKDTKDQQMIKSHIDLLKNAAEQAASGGKPGVAEAPRTPVRSEPGSVRARVTRREPAAPPPRARPAPPRGDGLPVRFSPPRMPGSAHSPTPSPGVWTPQPRGGRDRQSPPLS
jgi:anaphase-promoting complex subunit 3